MTARRPTRDTARMPDPSPSPVNGTVAGATDDGLREIVLHGHRVFYRGGGQRARARARPRDHVDVGHLGATCCRTSPSASRSSRPTCSATASRPSRAGTTRSGAYASGVRDLLIALGHERATFVGHSLGGGIAMQLAYQFPEHCERLVLVSSGGLGRDINALLRAASLPGSELLLPLLVDDRRARRGRGSSGALLGRVGLRVHTDLAEVLRGHASLSDGEARAAFLHTLRTIVDVRGQRVDATDRLYLAGSIPFLIVWGERDPIIPVEHARAAHRLVPGSRLEIFARRRATSRTSTIRCASCAC